MKWPRGSAMPMWQASLATAAAIGSPDPVAVQDYQKLTALAQSTHSTAEQLATRGSLDGTTCSWDDVQIRREWGTLSVDERKSYIQAAQCLQSRPSRTPRELAPGALTRFDDFVVTHINQTLGIHVNAIFLSWHRYYTWLYEQALRDECGYRGTQPYWDWPLTALTGLEASPIFDGSDTSMSGNGAYVEEEGDIVVKIPNGEYTIPPGPNGGGCVYSGPFANFSVNMGPDALGVPGSDVALSNPDGMLAYNPRCLKRDLTDVVIQHSSNATAVLSNIVDPADLGAFQTQLYGDATRNELGIHGGAHYAIGGDPGRDLYVSPGDPVFYLLHSMVDRVWWMWQMQDPEKRQWGAAGGVAGTITFGNVPPSRNATLDEVIEFGFAAGPPRRIRELLGTLSGPFCYVYL